MNTITLVILSAVLMLCSLLEQRIAKSLKQRRLAAVMAGLAWLLMLAAVHRQMDETQRLIAVRAAKPATTLVSLVSTRRYELAGGHVITWENYTDATGTPRTSRPMLGTAERSRGDHRRDSSQLADPSGTSRGPNRL